MITHNQILTKNNLDKKLFTGKTAKSSFTQIKKITPAAKADFCQCEKEINNYYVTGT